MLATLCVSLVVACIFDYGKGKIPNLLVTLIFAVGAAGCLYRAGAGGLVGYIAVDAVILLLLYPFFRIGGIGAGDVKLLGVCAGYFPHQKIFSFLFVSMLVAAIISMIRLVKERNAGERARYFLEYCADVFRSGKWQLYLSERKGKTYRGICLSGPILCSALLCWGGVY